jgi:hypothetical protein
MTTNLPYDHFLRVQNSFFQRQLKSMDIHQRLFHDTCYWIGFQYWLDDQIANSTEKHPDRWKNLQKQTGHSYFVRNLHYLYGSLELSLIGLVDPCLNLLRTVYESILKMYYLALFPEEAESVSNDLNKKHPKYNHGFLVSKLYTEETGNGCKRFFSILSNKAHSNYTGMGHTVTYSPNYIKQCMDNILVLSFYNILAELENQSTQHSILERELVLKIEPEYKKLSSLISDTNGMIPNFIPDKSEFTDKLGCHL